MIRPGWWLAERAPTRVREAIARATIRPARLRWRHPGSPRKHGYLLNWATAAFTTEAAQAALCHRAAHGGPTYASFSQQPPPNGNPTTPAHVGTGAVGSPPVVKAQIRERELLLLCSDGIHKYVSDEQIADVVSGGLSAGRSLEKICGALVHAAKRNGSHDDASALLVLRRPWFTPLRALAQRVLSAWRNRRSK